MNLGLLLEICDWNGEDYRIRGVSCWIQILVLGGERLKN